jgi:hypothetical protein
MACIYFKESTRATLLDVRSALFKKLYLQVYIMFFFNFTDVIYIWGFLNLMQILFTLNSIHHLTSNISTALWLVWFVGKLSIYAAAVMFTWARETVYKALLIQGWKPPPTSSPQNILKETLLPYDIVGWYVSNQTFFFASSTFFFSRAIKGHVTK